MRVGELIDGLLQTAEDTLTRSGELAQVDPGRATLLVSEVVGAAAAIAAAATWIADEQPRVRRPALAAQRRATEIRRQAQTLRRQLVVIDVDPAAQQAPVQTVEEQQPAEATLEGAAAPASKRKRATAPRPKKNGAKNGKS